MDIARPELKQKKRRRQYLIGGAVAVAILVAAAGLSALGPAIPSIERSSVLVDQVKRGELLREVRGPGTLVPKEIRWIAAETAAHVEHIVRAWRYVDRKAEIRETAERHRARALHVYQDEDGMVIIRGRLEPEAGAMLMQALAAARDVVYQQRRPLVGNEPPAWGQLQADALALIAETALHHGMDAGAAGERYQVVVHVDAAVLADPDQPGQSVLDGVHCSAEHSRRIACDASRVITSRGSPRASSDSCSTSPSAMKGSWYGFTPS